jgi:hypothetical protein
MRLKNEIPLDIQKEIMALRRKRISYKTIAQKFGLEEHQIVFFDMIQRKKRLKGKNRTN